MRDIKLSLFADYVVLYIGNPNDSTINLRINKFSKVSDTKSVYKNLSFFYTEITNYQKEKLRK